MIAPMANLKQLEQLKERYPQAFGQDLSCEQQSESPLSLFNKHIPTSEYATRRNWFGRAHKGSMKFYNLLSSELLNATEPTPFYQFVRRGIRVGPVSPHFYFANGSSYVSARKGFLSKKFINAAAFIKLTYSPYFLIDTNAIRTLPLCEAVDEQIETLGGITLPIGVQGDKLVAFSAETNTFHPIGRPTPKALAQHVAEQIDKARRSRLETKDIFIRELENHYPIRTDHWKGKTEKIMGNARYLAGIEDQVGLSWLRPLINSDYFLWNTFGSQLGLSQLGILCDTGGMRYEDIFYSPYMHALSKLTYLKLGINFDNEPLRDNPEIELEQLAYRASQDLAARCEQQPTEDPADCWWSNSHFSLDKYLNYHLANLFRGNEALKQKAIATVDFSAIKPWAAYSELVQQLENRLLYRDTAGTNIIDYDQAKYFIPGKEQALASCVLSKIRTLLYAALGEKAFYEATIEELENAFFRFVARRIYNFDFGNNRCLELAQKKVTFTLPDTTRTSLSFIDVWQEIITELKRLHPERTDWVCFDFHGWVLSWDPYLVSLQQEHLQKTATLKPGNKRLMILNRLGIAIIESWLSGKLNPFYVKKG